MQWMLIGEQLRKKKLFWIKSKIIPVFTDAAIVILKKNYRKSFSFTVHQRNHIAAANTILFWYDFFFFLNFHSKWFHVLWICTDCFLFSVHSRRSCFFFCFHQCFCYFSLCDNFILSMNWSYSFLCVYSKYISNLSASTHIYLLSQSYQSKDKCVYRMYGKNIHRQSWQTEKKGES